MLITPHCPVVLLPHQPARSCKCANKMVSCAALLASCSLEAPRFQLLSWPGIAARLVATYRQLLLPPATPSLSLI